MEVVMFLSLKKEEQSVKREQILYFVALCMLVVTLFSFYDMKSNYFSKKIKKFQI